MSKKKTQHENHLSYQVGLKVLLKKDGKFLFLKSPLGPCLDLPGGRIGRKEKDTPLTQVIQREIEEELGNSIKYKVEQPVFQFRRYFDYLDLHIFITVYEATFLSGEINLSSEHESYQWIDDPAALKEKDFLSTEEFLQFKNYFEKIKILA